MVTHSGITRTGRNWDLKKQNNEPQVLKDEALIHDSRYWVLSLRHHPTETLLLRSAAEEGKLRGGQGTW